VLIRTAPVFGAANPYDVPGTWRANLSFRNLTSDDHYRGDDVQEERHTLGTFVINKQNAADLTLGYALTRRVSLSVGGRARAPVHRMTDPLLAWIRHTAKNPTLCL